MSSSDPPSSPSGACWFCGRNKGRANSLAYPFWSNASDEVRVVVLPRCGRCGDFHDRQQWPFGLIAVACAALPLIAVAQLPLPEDWRTLVSVGTLVGGFALGMVVAAQVQERQARNNGIVRLGDHIRHSGFRVFAENPKDWRNRRGPNTQPGGRNTVTDFARYFDGFTRDPAAMAALERGCAEAGVPFECRR